MYHIIRYTLPVRCFLRFSFVSSKNICEQIHVNSNKNIYERDVIMTMVNAHAFMITTFHFCVFIYSPFLCPTVNKNVIINTKNKCLFFRKLFPGFRLRKFKYINLYYAL